MHIMIAHLRCKACDAHYHIFFEGGNPNNPRAWNIGICPRCGGLYNDWLNYPIGEDKVCRICVPSAEKN
jgi:hypothetical protein